MKPQGFASWREAPIHILRRAAKCFICQRHASYTAIRALPRASPRIAVASQQALGSEKTSTTVAAGVELGKLSVAHTEALGLKQAPIVRLSLGTEKYGIFHNWAHHKEMFTDLADSQKVLEETIGDPNARCVLSVIRTKKGLKRLVVVNNPDTGAYCVLNLSEDGTVARVVSWHRAPDRYGNGQWNKN